MKLKSIALKNFLIYEHAQFDLADVTMIFGHNDQGKTSLRDAIEYCLLGTARGIQRKNQAPMLCRAGCKDFEVAVETETGKYVRSQSNRGPASGDADMIRAIIDPMSILRMSQDDRQAFFTRHLLPKEKEPAKLSFQPDTNQFAAVLNCLTLGDIEGAYKEAYEIRREIGRSIKDINMPDAPPAKIVKVEGKEIDLSQPGWIDRLHQRRREHAVLDDQVKKAGSINVEALEQEKTNLTNQIAAAREAIASHENNADGHVEQLAAANQAIEQIQTDIANANGEAKALSLMVDNLKKSTGGQCVLSTPKLPIKCGSSAEIQTQRSALEKKLKAVLDQVKELTSSLEARKRDRSALNLERDQKAAANRQLQTEIVAADRQIAEIESKLKQATAISGADAQLADLAKKIKALEQICEAYQKYKEASADYIAGAEKKTKLEALHDQAEKLVEELGPDGPIRAAAAGAAGEVEFCPLAVDWNMSDLTLCRDGSILKGGIPVEMLGESAQYRAAILISHLAAVQVGFWVIDRFDIFLPDLADAFFKHIHQLREKVQVIIIGSREKPPKPAQSEWCKKYWVEAGTIREIDDDLHEQYQEGLFEAVGGGE